ncbi:MAG: class I tRNA ligase family protein, partial [Pseudoclavibacter sp.]
PVLRGGNLVVTEEGIREGMRQFVLPLWSTYYFFTTYANVARPGSQPYETQWRTDSTDPLDRYILAKTGRLVAEVAADFEALDSTTAAGRLRDFADVLTNWYVRRSRDRFWAGVGEAAGGTGAPGTDAFDTLYTVLETVARVAAPLAPLVTETVWRGLTGGRSVHLEDWPDASAFPSDDALEAAMDGVRDVTSAALALRKQAQLRVRLPLSTLTVVTPDARGIEPFADILRDELNVKSVDLEPLTDGAVADYGIERVLQVNARAAGPRLGKQVQQVIKASKTGDWSETDGVVTAGGIALEPGEYDVRLVTGDDAGDRALTLLGDGSILAIDTRVSPELAAEGAARDVIRAVQDARKSAGLDVSDRIRLALRTDDGSVAALEEHKGFIGDETLAVALEVTGGLEAKPDAVPHSYGALEVELEVAK